jgi:hypothetical protein
MAALAFIFVQPPIRVRVLRDAGSLLGLWWAGGRRSNRRRQSHQNSGLREVSMFRKALNDGNVWLASGMLCFALFFALEYWAGISPVVNFLRGAFIGLAIVAFGAAVAMLARQEKPADRRPAPSKKGRR